jgi:hypothetical protein
MEQRLLRRIRILLAITVGGLVLSGLTAFALEIEVRWLTDVLGIDDAPHASEGGLKAWLLTIRNALIDTNERYPFMAYGTDWLAFAHLVIAVFFLGAIVDPRRNVWIIVSGLIACAGVFLVAMIAGAVRHIPLFWRLIDCSFGLFCAIPLLLAWHWTRQLERIHR